MIEKLQPPEPPSQNEIIKAALDAAPRKVLSAAHGLWSSREGIPREIFMRSGTDLYLDTATLDHPRFAGYGIDLNIGYGPERYFLGTPGDFRGEAASIMSDDENGLVNSMAFDLRGSLLMREQKLPDILSVENANVIASDLKAVGQSVETGYSFSASNAVEVPVENQSFQYDREITIGDIKDSAGIVLDLLVSINLGFSDTSSSEANVDEALDSQRKADEVIDGGALVSTGFTLPRINAISFKACSRSGDQISRTPQTEAQLEAALAIGIRAFEIILDTTDSNNEDRPSEINLKYRSAENMLELSDDRGEAHQDRQWIEDLFSDE